MVLVNNDGALAVGRHFKDGVEQTIATRDDLYVAVVTGSPVRYVGIAPYSPTAVPALGVYDGTPSSSLSMNTGKFGGYVLVLNEELTDTQIGNVDTYLTANQF